MFRSTRTKASLIRSLMLGTAGVTAAVAAAAVVGCTDESQPDYWVEKLKEPAWQGKGIKRLEQFYEDGISRAGNNREDPKLKSLVDKSIVPLTNLYVEKWELLDTKTRGRLLRLVESMQDPRAEPAIIKAFEQYANNPKKKDYPDLRWALQAQKNLMLEGVKPAMLAAFLKFQVSTPVGAKTWRDFNAAMRAAPSQEWSGSLQMKLTEPMEPPSGGNAAGGDAVTEFMDQEFWQRTSAEVLGALGDETAIPVLIKVMLQPKKGKLHQAVLEAMTGVAKATVPQAMALMKGENEELVAYALEAERQALGASELSKDEPHVRIAAMILGTIGRPEALPAFYHAIENTELAPNMAILAQEITKLPGNPESKRAFQKAVEALDADSTFAQGAPALPILVEWSASFRDSSFVPWLLQRIEKTRNLKKETMQVQYFLTSAIKLMEPNQVEVVGKAVEKYGTDGTNGTPDTKDLFAQASALLKSCNDRLDCYLVHVEKVSTRHNEKQFTGIKAAYMVAIYGDESIPKELIKRLEKIENPAIRHVLAMDIDMLSPKGSLDVAETLNTLLEARKATTDKSKISGDQTLRQVMRRLQARAN